MVLLRLREAPVRWAGKTAWPESRSGLPRHPGEADLHEPRDGSLSADRAPAPPYWVTGREAGDQPLVTSEQPYERHYGAVREETEPRRRPGISNARADPFNQPT